jgi:hypothetical protein
VLREYDLAGRFGGEEFVMLLPQTRAVDAFRIAERVRAHISQLPIYAAAAGASGKAAASGTPGAERVPVTASIGVAALDAGSRRELTELLAAADAALYRAKASGRDQVQMISTSRGLSAVRPPADDVPAATPLWGGSMLSGAEQPDTGLAGPGLTVAGRPGRERPGEAVVREIQPEQPQLPAEAAGAAAPVEGVAEGSASTATTSALAV